jgi:hypothetical protein
MHTIPDQKEIQIKTTLRIYFTPDRKATIKKNKCWQKCPGGGHLNL